MTPAAIAFEPAELRALGTPPRGQGCDFCATGHPVWRYAARTVGLGSITYGPTVLRPVSVGAWAACQGCSALIEAGDWPGLARRTLRSLALDLSRAGPGTRVRLLGLFHQAQERFRQARTGPREGLPRVAVGKENI